MKKPVPASSPWLSLPRIFTTAPRELENTLQRLEETASEETASVSPCLAGSALVSSATTPITGARRHALPRKRARKEDFRRTTRTFSTASKAEGRLITHRPRIEHIDR